MCKDYSFKLADSSQGTILRKKFVMASLKKLQFIKILECGCGVGIYSKELPKLAENVHAFDLNPKLIEVAKKNVAGVNFFTADIFDLNTIDGKYDIVLATDVIEHLKSYDLALENISKILNDNGYFVLTVPSYRWDYLYKISNIAKEDLGHYHLFHMNELKEKMSNVGFSVVEAATIQNIFSAFIDVLIVKINILIHGKEKVMNSEMATEAANSLFVGELYCIVNKILNPMMTVFEKISPKWLKVEYLMVFQKK